ncbi:MAG: alpha/beta hydrolase, partial [Undibacterium sp.]|nr:alpha/beta hydrolase [Undibacterium sp.]
MNILSIPTQLRYLGMSVFVGALCACSTTQWPIAPTELAAADPSHISVKMDQLANCVSGSNQVPTLDPNQAVNLIVHGCNSSGGQYRALAEVFQKQGQQTLCFNYDDRDSITRSSDQLREVLQRLVTQVGVRDITVLGHSQGGLIARRALISGTELESTLQSKAVNLSLVTVSSPFGGIQAASHCSSTPLAILSLGLTIPICQ